LSKPARHSWHQRFDERLSYIHKRQSWRAQQVLQRSADIKIQIHGLDVDGPAAAILIIVEQNQGSTLVSYFDDLFRGRSEAVHKADVCKRNDDGVLVNQGIVASRGETVASCLDEDDLGATPLLSQPNVAHGGEFKFSQHNFASLAERKRTGDGVDRSRRAGD
jgi:hypothetical protein